jgi:hypothetical protein
MTSFLVDCSGAEMKSSGQVPVFPTTIQEIMSSPYFAFGAADRRAGRGYRAAYTVWDTNNQWDYERGRAWAVSAPRSVELRRDGKLNPAAIRWFHKDIL